MKPSKDLDEQIDEILNNYAKAYFEAKYESELNTCDWAMAEAKQQLLALIEQRELQGRLDEIRHLNDEYQTDAQDWMREHPGYTTAMIPMEDYVRRISELEAKLKAKERDDE